MVKTLNKKVKQAIKDNIEIAKGRILTGGKTLYKIVIDENEDVDLLYESTPTPTGSIGIVGWQFGNGFEIDKTTSDYRLGKVAARIVEEYQYSKKMREEYGV